jgi:chromosome segregation ATPase
MRDLDLYERNKQLFTQAMQLEKQKRLIAGLSEELIAEREALRKAHQEAQQWEDETCLEIDELDSIIDGQQEYIKTIQAQLHNTLERKLQMSFELSAAQQEIAALKHSHADACDMNRRLCLDLEQAEKDAEAKAIHRWGDVDRANFALRQEAATARAQADNATDRAIKAEQANNCLLDQLRAAEAKVEWMRQNVPNAYRLMNAVLR